MATGGMLPPGMKPSGAMTSRIPGLDERAADLIRRLLFSEDREGQRKAENLLNVGAFTPPGAALDIYDFGKAGAEGDVGGLFNAILSGILPAKSPLKEFDLIHGSGADFKPVDNHPFGKFDLSKKLTGEGTNYEGAGIYATDPKATAIAQSYAHYGVDSADPKIMIGDQSSLALHQQIKKEMQLANPYQKNILKGKLEGLNLLENQIFTNNPAVNEAYPIDKYIDDIIASNKMYNVNPDGTETEADISPAMVEFLNSFKGKKGTLKEPGGFIYDFTVHDSPDNFVNMHLPIKYQDDKIISAVDNWLKTMPVAEDMRYDYAWNGKGVNSNSDERVRDFYRRKFIDDEYMIPKEKMSKLLANSYANEHMEILKDQGVLGTKWFSRHGQGSRYRDQVKDLFRDLERIDNKSSGTDEGRRVDIEYRINELENKLMNLPITDQNFDKLASMQTEINKLTKILMDMDGPDDIQTKLWKIYNAPDLGYNYTINDPDKTTIFDKRWIPY